LRRSAPACRPRPGGSAPRRRLPRDGRCWSAIPSASALPRGRRAPSACGSPPGSPRPRRAAPPARRVPPPRPRRLLAGPLLGRLGLGERPRLGGACLGRGGLGLRLGPPQGDVPRRVDLDLLRLGLATGALLVGCGLGHPRVALPASRLLLPDELHVARLIADRLDRERVDLQAGRREVALGGVLHVLLELLSIEVELLDCQRADDRPERALKDVL